MCNRRGGTLNSRSEGGPVTAGSERPPRPSPFFPSCMGPCILTKVPTPLPRRHSAGRSPWMTTPGGCARQPRQGEGGGAIPDAPLCPTWYICRGPPRPRGPPLCWTVMLVADSTGGLRLDDGR